MKGHQYRVTREEGQSIVILAMAMVGLLVFAGLAVDAGVVYVTSVRLSRAVDAAALAGVVELPYEGSTTSTALADTRAQQFLAANEIWPTAEITGTQFFISSRQGGIFGTYRYLITATHQANLYFLPLVDFDYVRLTDSAVAEYNPLTSIYASQTGNYGTEQTSNLSIFGPDICTAYGDAYTPSNSPWWDELTGVYHFHLDIPADYEGVAQDLTRRWNGGTDTNNILRIEIWDPDCYNNPFSSNQFVITNTITGLPMTISNACGGNARTQPCIPVLKDEPYNDVQNPFGFVRIDENRGSATPGTCDIPSSYTVAYNTVTEYTLYYFKRREDGSLERRNLARYTKGGGNSDSDTDMLWVCPGGSMTSDAPATPDGWAGSLYSFTADEGNGNFEIDLSSEVPDIYVNPADGKRSIFLDIRGVSGASENGFDLWAGPRYKTVPAEVNARNIDIILNRGDYHSSAGATLFGMGHLPMNSNHSEVVTLTLAYVPRAWEGREIRVSAFDNDAGAQSVVFLFDTIPAEDWHYVGQLSGDNTWYHNDFTIPSVPTHTFYGGYLQAVYNAGAHDTFGWTITGEAVPKLVE